MRKCYVVTITLDDGSEQYLFCEFAINAVLCCDTLAKDKKFKVTIDTAQI